jgi:hypothetical protein
MIILVYKWQVCLAKILIVKINDLSIPVTDVFIPTLAPFSSRYIKGSLAQALSHSLSR